MIAGRSALQLVALRRWPVVEHPAAVITFDLEPNGIQVKDGAGKACAPGEPEYLRYRN